MFFFSLHFARAVRRKPTGLMSERTSMSHFKRRSARKARDLLLGREIVLPRGCVGAEEAWWIENQTIFSTLTLHGVNVCRDCPRLAEALNMLQQSHDAP